MRKIFAMLCISACMMAVSPVVAAEEYWGSIQIHLDAGDLAVTNGAVTLHQVGIKTEEGYRIAEAFGGGVLRQEDTDSNTLASWLAETASETGLTMLLDADGNAVFTELEEGLYLLVQTERMDGFYPIHPILLTIPQENRWDVRIQRQPAPVVTELPKTGQSPLPFLGVLGMVLSSAGLLLCRKKIRD